MVLYNLLHTKQRKMCESMEKSDILRQSLVPHGVSLSSPSSCLTSSKPGPYCPHISLHPLANHIKLWSWVSTNGKRRPHDLCQGEKPCTILAKVVLSSGWVLVHPFCTKKNSPVEWFSLWSCVSLCTTETVHFQQCMSGLHSAAAVRPWSDILASDS